MTDDGRVIVFPHSLNISKLHMMITIIREEEGADGTDCSADAAATTGAKNFSREEEDPLLLIVSLGFNYKEAFYLHTRSFIHINVSD